MYKKLTKKSEQSRFPVGFFHADVKGGDRFTAHFVFSGYIDTAKQADMVNGKTGYCLHIIRFYKLAGNEERKV